YGLVAFASSFDVIGPMGRSVEDVATLLNTIAGQDEQDATSAPVEVPDYTQALTGDVAGLHIGLPKEYFAEGLDAEIREMIEARVDQLREAGATVKEVSLPHADYGIATYYILATAEASSNLARYDGIRYGHRADLEQTRQAIQEDKQALENELATAESNGNETRVAELKAELDEQNSVLEHLYVMSRSEGFGDEVKRRIMLGTYVLSSGYYDDYYEKAQRVRTLIRNDFDRAFDEVDVLLTPVTPTPAFELGSKTDDPLEMYLSDVYTVSANLAGVPGLTVPIGTHPGNDLPVGMQLMGRHFDEATLLQVGDAVMRSSD
ncbi:MAG: Asp-tRNA(Asn)/Glu-tRNA(Gln) amidotransferase subunit GatA, partial [Bacteroidetes bacterium]|nr:Asp-tRNA(Asn)/Glu-tRNA(Gln) amidotransferase subunit GatA [Bacteroidota bacterium]